MTATSAAEASSGGCALSSADKSFLLRRLHSLTGIVPLGGFLLFHFFENASARRGPEAFNETVEKIASMPYLMVAEWALLLLPLIFHSVYGIYITRASRPVVAQYTHCRNIAYILQRVSGIVAFFYIAYHVVSTRFWALFVAGREITFQDMATKLSVPWVFALYIVGVLSVVYHFSNGLWSFSITWGLVRSDVGQKRLACVSMAICAVLSVVGIDILSAFVFKQSILSAFGI
jgi:succinate dehydrogenase / fumarate reductase cytochrome b subunit